MKNTSRRDFMGALIGGGSASAITTCTVYNRNFELEGKDVA
jgi:hypothetical protein